MRPAYLALCMTVALAGSAAAADLSAFDGTYKGTLTPTPGLSGKNCSPQDITALQVNKGQIQAAPGLPSFSGTINIKGFVDARMRKADGSSVPVQGRAETGDDGRIHVSAGVVDDQAGCAWTLDLTRQ